ncbi:MAG: LPS export ABC transporter permease LptF [Luminiphilus sp.]|nr:LPS export ABC transporter permease LptF [Luminiphilus sp.]
MRIFLYLIRDVVTHTLAVAFVLFLVVFSGRFIKYLAEAAVGSLSADVLLPVMLFKLPSFFELILPLALFIAVLLSLGRMYAESEMVVLKACGISPSRLAGYLLVPGFCVMCLVAGLTLYLGPEGSARAQRLLDNPRNAEGLQLMAAGRFKSQRGGELVTYTERIDKAGVMHNVFVVEEQSGTEASQVTLAQEAEIITDATTNRRYLELRGGTRYSGVPGESAYEAVAFQRLGELIPEERDSLRASTRIDATPTVELLSSDNPRKRATLWWRISLPFLVPVSVVIALALSKTDARRGRYARLGPALTLFLAYFLALTQARSLMESGSGAVTMLATHLIFSLVALVLLYWESISLGVFGRKHGSL